MHVKLYEEIGEIYGLFMILYNIAISDKLQHSIAPWIKLIRRIHTEINTLSCSTYDNGKQNNK